MTNPRKPLICKRLDRSTGEVSWMAIEPIQYWGVWVTPKRVPYILMVLAQKHVQKLNQQEKENAQQSKD